MMNNSPLPPNDMPLHLARLKVFYQNVLIYAGVNLLLFLLWLFFSRGAFWPGIVIFSWGAGILIQATLLGLMPKVHALKDWKKYMAVFSEDWEAQKLKTLGNKRDAPREETPPLKVATKPSPKKRPTRPASKK